MRSWQSFVPTLVLTVLSSSIASAQAKKPNILVIFGDDIGVTNVSAYSHGLVGYRTPNIDRIAREGMMFTDYYAEQSCTAGRSAFITGIATLRTGLSKVGAPGATLGLQAKDPTIAELLKPLGYATGQFGKNHLGDRNEYLPTVHGFDEYFGSLYHLNASEDPEGFYYPLGVATLTMVSQRVVLFSSMAGSESVRHRPNRSAQISPLLTLLVPQKSRRQLSKRWLRNSKLLRLGGTQE
jgi:arylsulfatase